MERHLSAILYADVAGYSRLTGLDEDKTHQKLDAALGLFAEQITAHGGQKVHEAGDAVLAEFHSVTAAVDTALQFQREMAERNKGVADDERLEFRIGVNLGEVIHDRGDIYGDGVNLTARIQELAEPGGVCVSGAVYEQVAGKIDEIFDDLGHRKLKNIAQPMRVFQVRVSDPDTSDENRPGWPYLTSAKKKPLATGGCLCRGVRYETWDEPILVAYCHCRFCQLATGAPLNAAVVYERASVRFHGDEPAIYTSSSIGKRGFCGTCGTTLFTRHYAPEEGDFISIRLATLDSPADFPPTAHYSVESQVPWLDINDGLPRIRSIDDPEMQRRWAAVGRPNPKDQLPEFPDHLKADSDQEAGSE